MINKIYFYCESFKYMANYIHTLVFERNMFEIYYTFNNTNKHKYHQEQQN